MLQTSEIPSSLEEANMQDSPASCYGRSLGVAVVHLGVQINVTDRMLESLERSFGQKQLQYPSLRKCFDRVSKGDFRKPKIG